MAKVNPGEMLPQERQQWILEHLRQRCLCPPLSRCSSSDGRSMPPVNWHWPARR